MNENNNLRIGASGAGLFVGSTEIMGGGLDITQIGNMIDIQGDWNNFMRDGMFTVINLSTGNCQIVNSGAGLQFPSMTVKYSVLHYNGTVYVMMNKGDVNVDAFYVVTKNEETIYNKVTNIPFGSYIAQFRTENIFRSGFIVIYNHIN